MADIAELVIKVKDDGTIALAGKNLDKFTAASGKAGRSTKKFTDGVTKSTAKNKQFSTTFDKLSQSIRLVDGPLGGVASRFRTFGSIVKSGTFEIIAFTVALAGLGFATRKFLQNTIKQENAVRQLNAVLRSTKEVTGITTREMQDFASALQRVTTFGDDTIITAQSMLLTFTKIGREVFPLALEAILNVATALQTDLKSAALQVGKALNDPIAGMTALQRSGIQFTASQKDTIKALVEMGEVAAAQVIILKELEVQFGGSARAARETLGGALDALKNKFGDLFEATAETAEKLAKAVNFLNENFTIFVDIVLILSTVIGITLVLAVGKLAIGMLGLGVAFAGMVGVAGLLLAAIVGLILAFGGIERALIKMSAGLLKAGAFMGAFTKAVVAGVVGMGERVMNVFSAIGEGLGNFLDDPFGGLSNFDALGDALDAGITDAFADAFDGALDEAKEFSKNIDEAVFDKLRALDEEENPISKFLGKGIDELLGKYQGVVDGIKVKNKELEKIFKKLGKDIEKSLADSFENVFTDGEFGFKKFGASILKIFTRLAAQIAAKMAFNFIGSGLSGTSIGQSLGFGTLKQGSDGGGGTGGGFSGFGFGGTGGISGSINNFGSSFGFGLATETTGLSAASSFTTTSLSSALGAGAFGFGAGGLIASLTGGNQLGGSIGGAIGGFAGSALAGVAGITGSALATALGGVILPGIGIIAGALIGSLFGGDPKKPIGGAVGTFTGTDITDLRAKAAGGADPGTSRGLLSTVSDFLLTVQDVIGQNITQQFLSVDISRHAPQGGQLRIQKSREFAPTREEFNIGGRFQEFDFDPADAESVNKAVAELTLSMIRLSEPTGSLAIALDNIETEGREAAEILGDIEFAAKFDSLLDLPDLFIQSELSVIALNEAFEKSIETTRRLGLEEAVIIEIRRRAFEGLQIGFDEDIRKQLLSIDNPLALALENLDELFALIRRNAFAFGGDMSKVEELFGKTRLRILEDFADDAIAIELDMISGQIKILEKGRDDWLRIANDIQTIQDRIFFGSPTNKEQKFKDVEARFEDLKGRIRGGDVEAFDELDQTTSELLKASLDYFGSTLPFFDVQAGIVSFLDEANTIAMDQVDSANTLIAELKLQTGLLETIAAIGPVADILDGLNIKRDDPRLLLPGQTFEDLEGQFNQKNLLPENLVRAAKVQASGGAFDFRTKEGTFLDFARSTEGGEAINEEFNRLIALSLGTQQSFAHGGFSTGGLALVGERGPELVRFGGGAQVFSARQTANAFTSSANDNSEVVNALLVVADEIRAGNEQRGAIGADANEMLGSIAKSSRSKQSAGVRQSLKG